MWGEVQGVRKSVGGRSVMRNVCSTSSNLFTRCRKVKKQSSKTNCTFTNISKKDNASRGGLRSDR